jgi:pimeloyl-ACP methyl ester carboxylesterase
MATLKPSRQAGFFLAVTMFLLMAAGPLSTPAMAQTATALRRADGATTPVLVYPARGTAPCAPVLILSHGFGGDETGLKSLAESMSARGWRVIAIGHRESGRPQLRAAFMSGGGLTAVDEAARRRPLHVARFADLDTVYNEAIRACRPPRLLLAGHSMGAQTTMTEAGAMPLIGRMGANRFDGYIALSPQGIGTTYGAGAWSGVSKPVLMITGTNDRTADGDYTQRLSAFEGLPPGRKRLAVISGAGHLRIGGIGSASVNGVVNALVAEFADQVASGTWAASRVGGAQIREK